jgi:citronellol/citronellal dehydrogenase
MLMKMSRTPQILADAVWYLLQKSSVSCTGNFFTDEEILAGEGITDLSEYAYVSGNTQFYDDLFIDKVPRG